MTSTFYLKTPKSDKESLILFSCHFKKEAKKFVYSTGEKVKPIHWNQKEKKPITQGKNKSADAVSIQTQLSRYSNCFNQIQSRCQIMNEEFTSQALKKEFDTEFKKSNNRQDIFFDAFDTFVEEKKKRKEWSPSTYKRYTNIKNHLVNFEKIKKYKITFNKINEKFHTEFTDYSMNHLGHINNTFSRNLGLVKTFLFWALENNYTYNDTFKKFKKKNKVITKQIALTKDVLQDIMTKEFKSSKLEKVRDVFIFSCVTGMRFGELKFVSKNTVNGNEFTLKEEKESLKEARVIPLNDIALYILRKYDYRLPLLSNQKYNAYIKDVFEAAGYVQIVEKSVTRGKEVLREPMRFCDRISTHTARRTFITMMIREGKSPKLIGKITGQTDIKTINQYYQVEDFDKQEAVDTVFDMEIPVLKRA